MYVQSLKNIFFRAGKQFQQEAERCWYRAERWQERVIKKSSWHYRRSIFWSSEATMALDFAQSFRAHAKKALCFSTQGVLVFEAPKTVYETQAKWQCQAPQVLLRSQSAALKARRWALRAGPSAIVMNEAGTLVFFSTAGGFAGTADHLVRLKNG